MCGASRTATVKPPLIHLQNKARKYQIILSFRFRKEASNIVNKSIYKRQGWITGNLKSQIGEAEFSGRSNEDLLAILAWKRMWQEWSLRNWGLAMVPAIWISYSLFLDRSNRIDFNASIPLLSMLTFSLTFLNEGKLSLQGTTQKLFPPSLHGHPGARIISSVLCSCCCCCDYPTVFCQIICVCVSPTRSSALGGQKPNGNLCFMSFGT